MNYADLIEEMASDGAPIQAIIRAIRALEAKDAELAERRAKVAERKRRQRDKGAAVTGQSRDSHGTDSDVSPDKESSPQTPFKETNPLTLQNPLKGGKGSRSRVAHRLPPSWQPKPLSDGSGAAEVASRRGEKWVSGQLERFRNHWFSASGANARKADWDAAWRNWLVSGDERSPMVHPPPNQSDFSRLVGNYE